MKDAVIVFPHQLFRDHPALKPGRVVYLVEEWLFFRQYNFHRQKLILHRAGMKFYESFLREKNYEVYYIETTDERNDIRVLIPSIKDKDLSQIHMADPADEWLMKRVQHACGVSGIGVNVYPSPSFLNTISDTADFFARKKTYFQTDFYISQRKQRNILIDRDGTPAGGKWSFDMDNREKFPKKETAPVMNFPPIAPQIAEAREYVLQHFPDNYGNPNAPHYFVADFDAADKWLADFLTMRFDKFGIYEDAIVAEEHVLHHSVLTPMLNTGLLTPDRVINAALQYGEKHQTPLNSVEGFIRQIIGWREFIHIVYGRAGNKQRTTNYWKFKRKIPKSFWTASTGIDPIDITISKILQTGYCHHIERLMVLGNFMLLCEFDADEVYRWFMEMFIDAYDWVMVPNVYGMTQFADGGLMATKPYISGSNYLMKMSNYQKGDWQSVWDGLFWRFMHVHRDFFLQNPRLGLLVGTFDKMSEEKRNGHLTRAESYLAGLG